MSDAFMDDPSFDPDDLASVFFGVASEAPPFPIPGLLDNDDGVVDITAVSERDEPAELDHDGYDHVSRYAGHHYSGDSEAERISGNGDARQSGRDRHNDAQRGIDAARAAGTRAIRRTAEPHSGSHSAGHGGGVESEQSEHDRVSQSIGDAAERIRNSVRDDSLVDYAATKTQGGQIRPSTQTGGQPLTRTTSKITNAPTFRHTALQAQMFGLKANVNGEWMLTLKIPAECFEGMHQLNGAFGLELDVEITRRPIRRSDG